MRNAFAAELTALASMDPRIVLLSGDIGNRLFDPFKKEYPKRFFNCGVAEANMTSVAAGMALCGMRPITYTITPFNTSRCLEQIRVDACYHNLPVTIVGVGAGLSYAGLGSTHHSCEDIAMLRVLPNMTVICPADATEVRLSLRAAASHDGPVYIRLGKKNEPVIHKQEPVFKIGKGIIIRKGDDVCLLNTGNMLPVAVEAAELLEKKSISAQVVSMHTVKPLDTDLLGEVFADFKLVVTVEEHSRLGGIGSAVAEWLSDQRPGTARLLRLGTDDKFLHGSGNQANARKIFGLTPDQITERIQAELL
ncbi:MAG: transketolase [Desulfobacterales bacterium]|nr:transketolase [Desulfobacterales bacterium]